MVKYFVVWLCLYSFSLFAAPKDTSLHLTLQDLNSQMSSHQYLLNSHKVDLDLLQERYHDLETILNQLKQQIGDQTKTDREVAQDRLSALEKRMMALEKTNDTMISDLQQLKDHFNDSAQTLVQCKSKLTDLDKQVSQDIRSLKKTMESMISLLQKPKETLAQSPSSSSRIYRVKPGDSLGKIAQDNQVDVRALKELNNLSNDRIIVGQSLQLP